MTRPFEQPDYPSDEEIEALRVFAEQAIARGDALRRDGAEDSVEEEPVGEGEPESGPSVPANAYAYIPRSVSPASWNRSTRWGAGTRRLPAPPSGATEHVTSNWAWILSRVMTEGWKFCREHAKQEPAWYVDFAKVLAREEVVKHVARCPKDCGEQAWLWLIDRTDKTPTLDATPFPEPYKRRLR